MENIYRFSRNELISLREHFEEYRRVLPLQQLPRSEIDIRAILNINEREFDELEKLTDLDENFSFDENIIEIPNFDITTTRVRHKTRLTTFDFSSESTSFKTFRKIFKSIEQQKAGIERKGSTFGKSIYCFKYVKHDFMPIQPNETLIEPYSDIVITIRFYRPFRYQKGATTFGPCFAQEFLVLGSQYLNELRDQIDCISNNRCLFDISENPNQIAPVPNGNSGFFFISNIFYNDTRLPENVDYSKTIRDWYAEKNEFEEEFKVTSMESTQFIDLNVRLGFPQVYLHHGNCEHLFTFSKVHLISKNDHLRKSDYPILQSYGLENSTLCSMCGFRQYVIIVKESDKHVHDPAYLCRECFEKYHYIDGKKCNNFKAYQVNPNEIISVEEIDEFDSDVEEQILILDSNTKK